jgi:hypothetical protein
MRAAELRPFRIDVPDRWLFSFPVGESLAYQAPDLLVDDMRAFFAGRR